jgi:environmental stress-induced protein Ves
MQIVRAHEQRAMPWKNGGGVTYEIAAFPEGAGIDAFDWRLSMADVKTDGPFSLFPGIDRSLGIVTGTGLILRIAGRDDIRVEADTPSPLFAADVATESKLIDGPVLDLNIMTTRGRWSHHLRLQKAGDPVDMVSDAVRILVAQHGHLTLGAIVLEPRDALIVAPGEAAPVITPSDALFFHIDLWRNV